MKNNIKVTISIAILTIVIFSSILYKNYNDNMNTKEAIHEIIFPQYAGYINDNLHTKVKIDKKSVKNKNIINEYYITKAKYLNLEKMKL